MKRLMVIVAFLLLAGVGGAQVSMIPKGGSGSGTVTLTSGTTATSGCLDGAPLKSNSNVVTCTKMDLTKFMTADQSDDTGSFVNVTDLGFSVAANTVYAFSCSFTVGAAATTTGVQVALNGPASPTNLRYVGDTPTSTTATAFPAGTTYDSTDGASTGVPATTAVYPLNLNGTLENGANAGTLFLRLRTEVGGSAATLYRGSWCRVWTP